MGVGETHKKTLSINSDKKVYVFIFIIIKIIFIYDKYIIKKYLKKLAKKFTFQFYHEWII